MLVVKKLISSRLLHAVSVNVRSVSSNSVVCQKMDDIKTDMQNIFLESVKSVDPNNLVKNTLVVKDNVLTVRDKSYVLNKNCFLVGFGKAVLGMATETEKIIGEHLVCGIVSVPQGIQRTLANKKDMIPGPNSVLEICEGALNNLPDKDSERAAVKIKELAESADENTILLVLVSGGGSALLPLPRPPVTLKEKGVVIKLLASAGADITELNCIRKKLSLLKGGGLARVACPARVVALVLSDVIGDPLDFIASGPTVANADPPEAAMKIVRGYSLTDKVPPSVTYCLSEGVKEPSESHNYDHVQNVVIGNNTIAVEWAKEQASSSGYFPVILSTKVEGLVRNVGKMYADLAGELCKSASGEVNNLSELLRSFGEKYEFFRNVEDEVMQGVKKVACGQGLCLIAGGETTVVVRGRGLGGRNQELALEFASYIHNLERSNPCVSEFNVALLSCGTDGIDGPTTAAGAVGYSAQCYDDNLKPQRFLLNNDSHNFYRTFNGGSDLVSIGHTGTNVMDVHILVIKKK